MPTKKQKAIAKDTERKLTLAERRCKALQLRKEGMSYRQIANELKVALNTAHKDVTTELAKVTKEPAEQVLEIELHRLDDLLRVASQVAFDGGQKAGNRLAAIDRTLRIMDRRAKYLGIDEPKQTNESEEVKKALLDLKEVATQFAQAEEV